MIEFVSNIGKWLMENKDQIILFFTSGQFTLLIAQVVVFVKTIKSTKTNTVSTNALNKSVATMNAAKEDLTSTKKNSEDLLTKQNDTKETIDAFEAKFEEKLSMVTDKLNAIIEVQSIVYSSIKDEKVRNTVNNILVNAKYAETAARAKLQQELEELKAQVNAKVKDITNDVEKTTQHVSKALVGEVKNDEPVRY